MLKNSCIAFIFAETVIVNEYEVFEMYLFNALLMNKSIYLILRKKSYMEV